MRLLPFLVLLAACSSAPSDPAPAEPAEPGIASIRAAAPAPITQAPPGEPRLTGGHLRGGTSSAVSPDGRLLAIGAWNGTVRIQDRDGTVRAVFEDMTEDIEDLAFSPDGTRLASVSRDSTGVVYDVAEAQLAWQIRGHEDSVEGLAWAPEGKHLATACWDGVVRLFDGGSPMLIGQHEFHRDGVFRLAFDPSGTRLASASSDGTIVIASVPELQLLHRLEASQKQAYAVAWSEDGGRIAAGTRRGEVIVWDAGSGSELLKTSFGDQVLAVALNGDGSEVLASGWDAAPRSFSVATGDEVPSVPGRWGGKYELRP